MTASRFLKRVCASAADNSKVRLSGVVTSTDGRLRVWRARSAEPVSPVRRPPVQAGSKAVAGVSSAFIVSAASARIGVIHSTRKPAPGADWPRMPRSSAAIHSA